MSSREQAESARPLFPFTGARLWSGLFASSGTERTGRLQPASETYMVRKSEQIPAFEQTLALSHLSAEGAGGAACIRLETCKTHFL